MKAQDMHNGQRVRGQYGHGTLDVDRATGHITVRWDNTPAAYDRDMGDRVATSTWDLVEFAVAGNYDPDLPLTPLDPETT